MSEILTHKKIVFPDDHENNPGLYYEYQELNDGAKRQRSWNPSNGDDKPKSWDENPSDDLPVQAKVPNE